MSEWEFNGFLRNISLKFYWNCFLLIESTTACFDHFLSHDPLQPLEEFPRHFWGCSSMAHLNCGVKKN